MQMTIGQCAISITREIFRNRDYDTGAIVDRLELPLSMFVFCQPTSIAIEGMSPLRV